MTKKIYVLDTSVYLTDANSIYGFGANDIIVPLCVLDEIDKHKNRPDAVGTQARSIIRKLDSLREKGNLFKGVRIEKGHGLIYVKNFEREQLPDSFDIQSRDNQILAVALTKSKEEPKRKVIVVSRDINLRVKCDGIGLLTENFNVDQAAMNSDEIYSGFRKVLVDEQLINNFYTGQDVFLDQEPNIALTPNQFVMLVSNSNEKKTALARFFSLGQPLTQIRNFKKSGVFGLKPKNKEQSFALDLLMDPTLPLVTLAGKSGTGKTLCAIAAGLQQTLEPGAPYKKVIVTKPVQPMGRDIGFLPGSAEEKLMPWLKPIQDNLEFLLNKSAFEMYLDSGVIEIEAMTFIRGRSIANAFIILDEAQNLSLHEIKTVLTRISHGSKIVLTGDIEQVDKAYIDEMTNGLTHVIEKFKEHDISGHVTFVKGERSKLATIASRVL